jgi:hypothetical protein
MTATWGFDKPAGGPLKDIVSASSLRESVEETSSPSL